MQAFNQVPAFNISREALLTWPLPPIPSAPRSSTAIHASTYRLAWGELQLWDTFAGEVTNYWQNLPQTDKTAFVYTQASYNNRAQQVARAVSPPTNEGDVKDRQGSLVPDVYNHAAVGLNHAPMPSDAHSRMVHINSGGHTNLTVDGTPDFVFSRTQNNPYFAAWDPYAVLGEVKCPWLVTATRIDQVLHTINPLGFRLNLIPLLTVQLLLFLIAMQGGWQLNKFLDTWFAMVVHMALFRLSKDGVSCSGIMVEFSE